MATIRLEEDQIPAVEEGQQGDRFKIVMTVEQTSAVNDGVAEFDIEEATKRPATVEEDLEQDEENDLPDFTEATEQARQEVLTPSQGEGQGTQSPEPRTV